jgi:Divergent InlB B-repeat domain
VCLQAPGLSAGPVTSTTITVRWNDATPGESRFELAYGPSGQPATFVTLPPNTTSYVHTNVPAGGQFDYQVRVCDPSGCSAWSNKITVESNTRKLTVSRDGLGSVTAPGIACGNVSTPSDCSEIYSYGTTLALTAKYYTNPKLGIVYTFDHWEGACTGTTKTCTLTMTANRSVTAVFISIGN